MPLLDLFKNRKSRTSSQIFDDARLSLLQPIDTGLVNIDYENKSPESNDTPIDKEPNEIYAFCTNPSMQTVNDTDISPVDMTKTNELKSSVINENNNNCDAVLMKYGYKRIKTIRNTSQGEIFEVRSIKNKMERFAVKRVNKQLFSQKITKQQPDGTHIMVEKNIVKEALLMHYTTVTNIPPAQYICKFIKFIQDETHFYLVMEYGGNINLEDWVKKAFEYIKRDKLDLKQYKKSIKYIFWQLSVLIYWLHNDMSMVHMNISLENIAIKNGDFIENSDGSIQIDNRMQIKLLDLSLSEVFESGDDFKCNKHCFLNHSQYAAPKVFNIGNIYNARSADIWSLGMVLYRMAFGEYPFKYQNAKTDPGFYAIKSDRLESFIRVNNKGKYTNNSMFALISRMLNYDETKRFDALQILQNKWFTSYWQKYKVRITKKSFSQRERLKSDSQQKCMQNFPYYHM